MIKKLFEKKPCITSTDKGGNFVKHIGNNAIYSANQAAFEAGTAIPTLEYAMDIQGKALKYLKGSIEYMEAKNLIFLNERLLDFRFQIQQVKNTNSSLRKIMRILFGCLSATSVFSWVACIYYLDKRIEIADKYMYAMYLQVFALFVLSRIKLNYFQEGKDIFPVESLCEIDELIIDIKKEIYNRQKIRLVV